MLNNLSDIPLRGAKLFLLSFALFFLVSCSTKSTYDNLNQSKKLDCERKLSDSERADCLRSVAPNYQQYEEQGILLENAAVQLAELMEGTFVTSPSDVENYFSDRRVIMSKSSRDGVWLYYQLNTGKEKKLYRQRFIHLKAINQETVVQRTFSPIDKEKWQDAWENPLLIASFNMADYENVFEQGCDQVWKRQSSSQWRGYVDPNTCKYYSERRGADIFIESESVLNERKYLTSERGFDADRKQLFGSEPSSFIHLFKQ